MCRPSVQSGPFQHCYIAENPVIVLLTTKSKPHPSSKTLCEPCLIDHSTHLPPHGKVESCELKTRGLFLSLAFICYAKKGSSTLLAISMVRDRVIL